MYQIKNLPHRKKKSKSAMEENICERMIMTGVNI
jgi:hypothetical protein